MYTIMYTENIRVGWLSWPFGVGILPGHGKRLPNLARWARCAAGGLPNALFSVTYSMAALQTAVSQITKEGNMGNKDDKDFQGQLIFSSCVFHCDVYQKLWVCFQGLSSIIVYLGCMIYSPKMILVGHLQWWVFVEQRLGNWRVRSVSKLLPMCREHGKLHPIRQA